MPEPTTDLTLEQKDRSTIIASLTEREAQAYRYFIKSKQPELSPDLSNEMYELFAMGRTCEDIRKLRGPGFNYGAIVHARIRDLWDTRLQNYQREMVQRVPQVVQQTQLESAEFISKLLAGAHKLLSTKIDQFLASGDQSLLIGTPLENLTLRQYQNLLATLATATGQDNKKTVHHTGGITVTPSRQPSAADHQAMLDAIEIK